jgi:hypothetical protein
MNCRPSFCRPVETFSPRHAVGDQRRGASGDARGPRRAFDALCCMGWPARGWRGLNLVPGPRSGRTHRDWITDKSMKRFARVAFGPPVGGFKRAPTRRGPARFHPCRDTPSARGVVCKTVATGCAGSTPGLCTTPATRAVAQPAERDAGSVDGAGSTRRLHQHHPLALVAQGTRRRRAKPETGGSSPLGGTRMFAHAGDESADRIGLVGISSSSASQP